MQLPTFLANVDDTMTVLCGKLENNSIAGLVGMGVLVRPT